MCCYSPSSTSSSSTPSPTQHVQLQRAPPLPPVLCLLQRLPANHRHPLFLPLRRTRPLPDLLQLRLPPPQEGVPQDQEVLLYTPGHLGLPHPKWSLGILPKGYDTNNHPGYEQRTASCAVLGEGLANNGKDEIDLAELPRDEPTCLADGQYHILHQSGPLPAALLLPGRLPSGWTRPS